MIHSISTYKFNFNVGNNYRHVHALVKRGCQFATTFSIMSWVIENWHEVEYAREIEERDKKVRLR